MERLGDPSDPHTRRVSKAGGDAGEPAYAGEDDDQPPGGHLECTGTQPAST